MILFHKKLVNFSVRDIVNSYKKTIYKSFYKNLKKNKNKNKTLKKLLLLIKNKTLTLFKNNINFLSLLNKKLKQAYIKYIINISFFSTNTIINVLTPKGLLKTTLNSGMVNLKGRRKVRQPFAVLHILKKILLKTKFLYEKEIPVSVHFNKHRYCNEFIVIKKLKKTFFLNFIRSKKLKPHNGCRPKKLKIKKFRTRKKRIKKTRS